VGIHRFKTYMDFIFSFKYLALNAWRCSEWPKHIAFVDRTNKIIKFVVVDGNTHISFNVMHQSGWILNKKERKKIIIYLSVLISCHQALYKTVEYL
jgi:hypothetical protein